MPIPGAGDEMTNSIFQKGRSAKRTSADKVRRAASHLKRPGAKCQAPAGRFVPRVDHARCEAKGDCIEVCPYNVFDINPIQDTDYRMLPWIGKLRVRIHGMQTAYTPRSERCLACGLCVVACPQEAIDLIELAAQP
jgi:4Fe-4S ferredoxin